MTVPEAWTADEYVGWRAAPPDTPKHCSGCGIRLARAEAHHVGCPRAGLDYLDAQPESSQ